MCGPASIVPPSALTVIVSTWFVPTGLVAVAGVIWMFAFTQSLLGVAAVAGVGVTRRAVEHGRC